MPFFSPMIDLGIFFMCCGFGLAACIAAIGWAAGKEEAGIAKRHEQPIP